MQAFVLTCCGCLHVLVLMPTLSRDEVSSTVNTVALILFTFAVLQDVTVEKVQKKATEIIEDIK